LELPIAALGSLNPGKLISCRRCFDKWPAHNYSFEAFGAPSGVADQPIGLEQTLLGAKNRARGARENVKGAEIGIGLESGVMVVDDLHFDFCACAIYNGTNFFVGISSCFVLPRKVAEAFLERGYNQAFEDIGFIPDPNGAGVLGEMSRGVLSRPAQMEQAVDMALVQFTNPHLH
jgi:inosine/xanthosine triphosphatase